MSNAVALVPARAGSKRVPGKNIADLAGHPLIAYSIAAARESGLFTDVIVSTDSGEIAEVAERYGATVPGLRPTAIAGSTSPDILWVQHALEGRDEALFSILRPTSPFRTAATIRRAWDQLHAVEGADSIRAVRKVREHPGKMWRITGDVMVPFMAQTDGEVPTHSRQTASLPEVYVQDSSLEIAYTRIVADGEIAGSTVVPFLTEGYEGLSIDYPDELDAARVLAAEHPDLLPRI
ncbi:acylneuraminate cytidylyltransferase family protein [Solirubrobacter soli]|uniref:acylneuraminate cytidylyltransferase family protein n=1 Tax=Solirubrobacter soli TaxID=363832 RepID=UPI0004105F46|nr:acylneuraminate cytidylyltransferase family protein [Solirubrobacter soli]